MYSNILVPISFDQERDAAGAIKVAHALAGNGAQITLLHVIEHIPDYAAVHLPEKLLANRRAEVAEAMEKAVAEVPNSKGEVVSGHAGRTILDWAGEHDVDCIVIASHRPGMQDLLLGSTAAKVVRHAPCAVHVLR